jgi:hypothetical protein
MRISKSVLLATLLAIVVLSISFSTVDADTNLGTPNFSKYCIANGWTGAQSTTTKVSSSGFPSGWECYKLVYRNRVWVKLTTGVDANKVCKYQYDKTAYAVLSGKNRSNYKNWSCHK